MCSSASWQGKVHRYQQATVRRRVRELRQSQFTTLELLDDFLNLEFICIHDLRHTAAPFEQKKSPARKLRTGVVFSKVKITRLSSPCKESLNGKAFNRKGREASQSGLSSLSLRFRLWIYFRAVPPTRNALTTMFRGCTPTGIMVKSEYSLGSSFRGLRF